MSIHVVAVGNVTRDVEVVETTNSSVSKFTVASNRRISADKTVATFVDVEAWATNGGDFAAKFFKKGSLVEVVGTLEQNNWEDNEGNKRSKLFVRAINVGFGPLPPKKKEESEEEQQEEAPAPKQAKKPLPAKKPLVKPAAKKPLSPQPKKVLEEQVEDVNIDDEFATLGEEGEE